MWGEKKFLVTAGPTYEPIDPIRFISNHSSGKMGYAIAEHIAEQGATVTLISGPTSLITEHKNINIISVVSAEQMYNACISTFPMVDCAIMTAAVADFTPVSLHNNKIKRSSDNITIELKPTIDIAAKLGGLKKNNQIIVGFALETDNEIKNAKLKLKKKNFDFIVLNSLNDKDAGFNHDTNKITIIDKHNNIKKFELKHKTQVARDIVDKLIEIINQKQRNKGIRVKSKSMPKVSFQENRPPKADKS